MQAPATDSQNASEDTRSPAARFADEIRVSAGRETVEAFVVAFILALLFRAFVAEAFVIPTGSMAPTLMGAHKDIFCDQCGTRFPVGASVEQRGSDSDLVGRRSGRESQRTVVGGFCPNCRRPNTMDLRGNSDHETFSGDRILVSKFAYAVHDPDRWDVIVFKYPGNPKQNYIKRLVGLPSETLRIFGGDVYTRPLGDAGADTIARKPPAKLLAMRHLVHDSDHQSVALANAGFPSRWQAWNPDATQPPSGSWTVVRSEDGLTASLPAADTETRRWLRYFHRFPTQSQWSAISKNAPVTPPKPYESRLITDFYGYNTHVTVNSSSVYLNKPRIGGSLLGRFTGASRGTFREGFDSDRPFTQFRDHVVGPTGTNDTGPHWVGDLIFEADVETSADSKSIVLEIVEAGVLYRCQIDLADGTARMSITDAGTTEYFDGSSPAGGVNLIPAAATDVRAGTTVQLRFANADDQLVLWVNQSVVEFNSPTTYDARRYRPDNLAHPRSPTPQHPLDASPVGIAVVGGSATIDRLRIDRDKYYIALDERLSYGISDYGRRFNRKFKRNQIDAVFTDPESWDSSELWSLRSTVRFRLEEKQFFPMGDNSPQSLDARLWAKPVSPTTLRLSPYPNAYRFSDAAYVPRDLLVGKAVYVFWPHCWNSPVPYTPNFKRMGLIQ